MTYPTASKRASGFFITIDGNIYEHGRVTVFSRTQAVMYASRLRSKDPTRTVKIFGCHGIREQ